MRAAIYCRVSTDEQEKGYSLGIQADECRRFSELNNYTICEIFQDDVSGKIPLYQRPGGSGLKGLVAAGKVDVVIVHRVDRLSRDMVDTLVIVREWLRQGIVIYALDVGQIKSESDIVLVMKAWQTGDEHSKIVERTTAGRRAKAASGKIVMTGIPPYGYSREGLGRDAHLVINPEEAEIVRKIFKWYAGGMALRAIAYKLDEMGISPPSYRVTVAKHWHENTVRGIIKNTIYVGVTYSGKSKVVKGKRFANPESKWIKIDCPELAIIDRETFDTAQARARRNSELSARNKKHDYLLAGYFRCGLCGRVMSGATKHAGKYDKVYYRCSAYARPRQYCENQSRSVPANTADTIVWGWVYDLLTDDAKLDKGLREMAEKRKEELAPKRARLDSLKGIVDRAAARIRRLAAAVGDEEDEEVTGALKEEIKSTARIKEAAEKERSALEAELRQLDITQDMRHDVLENVRKIRGKLERPDVNQQRELLELLKVKVVFHNGDDPRLEVSCSIEAPRILSNDLYESHRKSNADPGPARGRGTLA